MNCIDMYLQRNKSKRYEVYKITGVSQQLLATHTSKKVKDYSNKVIMALGKTLNKTPGTVLDELLALEKENPSTYEAFSPDELLIGLKAKYDYIIIKGEYNSKIYELMKNQLSDNETLGLELGSGGIASVVAYAVTAAVELLNDSNKIDKEIEKKIVLYKLHSVFEDKIVLKLKQLDY